VINGVCEEWEDANMCPSDCGTITTTTTTTTVPAGVTTTTAIPTAVCGNYVCEEVEDQSNCPEDCLEATTTTTQPAGPILPTGMVAAFTGGFNLLMLILMAIALVLGVFRFKVLPILL
jgi:hypothetical protein